jgi:hypothetical protein
MNITYEWQVTQRLFAGPDNTSVWFDRSLIRIQFGGPWCSPTAHWMAASGHTHWIACRHVGKPESEIYDINASCAGGWISITKWEGELLPWLIKEHSKKADGTWWQTHRAIIKVRA